MKHKEDSVILKGNYTFDILFGIISICNFVVGMRLHSIIFSATNLIPFVSIIYDPKVKNILKQLDCEEYGIELSKLNEKNFNELLEKIVSNNKIIKKSLSILIKSQRKKVITNFNYILKLPEKKKTLSKFNDPEILAAFKKIFTSHIIKLDNEYEFSKNLSEQNQKTIQESSDKIKQLASEKTSLIQEISTIQNTNLENQETITKLQTSLETNQKIIEETSSTIKQLASEKTSLIQEISTIQNTNLKNQETITKLQTSLETNQKTITDKESQITKLQTSLETNQKIIEKNNKIINQLDTEKNSLMEQISSLQAYNEDNQRRLNDIYQSFVWRSLRKYDNSLGKIFPIRTKKYLKSTKEESTKEEQKLHVEKALAKQLFDKKDIICFPIIDWNFRFQRPQHLMSKFAKKGHRVFYLTVSLRPLNKSYEMKTISENIYQVELRSPKLFDIYKDKLNGSLITEVMESIKNLKNDLKIDAVSFVEFPTWAPLVLELRNQYGFNIIFDCLDDFTGFSNVTKERRNEEKNLLQKSDLVIATSSYLLKKVMKETSKSLFLPNAGDFEHFNKSTENLLKDFRKPIVGYFGSIAEWFDKDLIEFLANKRPDLTFVFIGYTFGSDIRKLEELENVHFLGEMPYSELPKYLCGFDVCLIPFKNVPLIEATHPVKIYEYMAAGKPVIATKMIELLPMADLCYVAEDKDNFLKKLDNALNENDEKLKTRRMEFASKNTWDDRFNLLYSELNKIKSFNINHHN